MSYAEQAALYRGDRSRYDMCVREQGSIFSADGRPEIAALGTAVVRGSLTDIDAVIAAICVGPSWDGLDDDAVLLSAVQAVWPAVAAALYPQT